MIKTWQERVASIPYLSIGMPLTAHDKEAAMQDEIDELRAENARLKANLETRKSNYNRLKAMVDDGSISDRTFSLCEELEKENARLRAEVDQWKVDFTEVLTDTKRLRAALTTARTALIEHGSAYLHHELRYQEALDAARAALGNKS